MKSPKLSIPVSTTATDHTRSRCSHSHHALELLCRGKGQILLQPLEDVMMAIARFCLRYMSRRLGLSGGRRDRLILILLLLVRGTSSLCHAR